MSAPEMATHITSSDAHSLVHWLPLVPFDGFSSVHPVWLIQMTNRDVSDKSFGGLL